MVKGLVVDVRSWFDSLSGIEWIQLISTIATVAALIFAARQLKVASDSHKHNQDAQKASLRPYVVAQILPPRSVSDGGRIGVKNFGKTVARNVKVTFDPPLPSLTLEEVNENSASGNQYMVPTIKIIEKVFGKPFPTIAPGQQVESFYWNRRKSYDGYLAPKRFKSSPDKDAANYAREARERINFVGNNAGLSADGFHEDTLAVITYEDDEGNQYCEHFGLNPAVIDGYTFIETAKSG